MQKGNAEILIKFKEKAEALGATQFVAVATAVFRKAANGAGFLEMVRNKIGIPVEITSQVTHKYILCICKCICIQVDIVLFFVLMFYLLRA